MTNSATAPGEKRRRIVVLALVLAALLVAMTTAVWFASRPADDDAGSHERDGPAATTDPANARIASGTYGVGVARATRRARGNDRITVPADETNGRVRVGGADPATAGADGHVAEDGDAANGAGTASASEVRAGVASSADTRSGGAAGRRDLPANVTFHVTAAESGEAVRDAVVVFTLRDQPPRDLTTDGNGRAVFPAPVGATAAIDVKARGRFRERRDTVSVSSAETAVKIVLTRGVVVRGTVTGPAGPVRGAKIRAVDHAALLKSLPYDAEPRAIETSTTDRSGRYWLDCIPRGVAYDLVVEAGGLAPETEELDAQPDVDYAARKDVELGNAWVLLGSVRDTDGKPIADAWVYAFDPIDLDAWRVDGPFPEADNDELAMLDALRHAVRNEGWIPPRARSDKDGRYRLLVPEMDDSLRVMAMHGAAGRSIPSEEVDPKHSSVELVVRGRVRAQFEWLTADGKPAERLTTGPYFPWDKWSVSPTSPGRYGIADMEEGPMACVVAGAAGAPGVYVGERVDEKTLVWRGKLRSPVVWRGTVIDDRHVPVVGARVSAGPVNAFSGDRGEFIIQGVHPQQTELSAIADGHPEVDVGVRSEERERITVTLPRVAPLRLRLKLPERTPAPTWYRVWTFSSKERSGRSWNSGWEDRFVWNDGEIEMANVRSGDDELAIFVPGYTVRLLRFSARPGEPTDLGTIALVAPARAGGQVVDEAGVPVPYASVFVRTTGNTLWLAFLPERWIDCDGTGSFVADVVAPGEPYEILATATGFATTPQDPSAYTGDRPTVVIGRGFEIRGRWLTHDGSPAVVRFLGPGATVYAEMPLTRDGTFEATVPRRPRAVAVLDPEKPDGTPRAKMDVPATFPDGDVLLIP